MYLVHEGIRCFFFLPFYTLLLDLRDLNILQPQFTIHLPPPPFYLPNCCCLNWIGMNTIVGSVISKDLHSVLLLFCLCKTAFSTYYMDSLVHFHRNEHFRLLDDIKRLPPLVYPEYGHQGRNPRISGILCQDQWDFVPGSVEFCFTPNILPKSFSAGKQLILLLWERQW